MTGQHGANRTRRTSLQRSNARARPGPGHCKPTSENRNARSPADMATRRGGPSEVRQGWRRRRSPRPWSADQVSQVLCCGGILFSTGWPAHPAHPAHPARRTRSRPHGWQMKSRPPPHGAPGRKESAAEEKIARFPDYQYLLAHAFLAHALLDKSPSIPHRRPPPHNLITT